MRKRIGEFLADKGMLTVAQVQEILNYSQKTGLRFGDAAVEMGILTRERLIQVFGPSFGVDFFHLDPLYFPKITQDLMPVDLLVRYGALPLGFKTEHRFFKSRKLLNLGLLDPSRAEAVEEVMKAATARYGASTIHGVKVFLILADQFLTVLKHSYGLENKQLLARPESDLDDTLTLYLENVN